MLKYKHIEASRELRLWLGQVIIPVASAALIVMSNDNARNYVTDKYRTAKETIKAKFHK